MREASRRFGLDLDPDARIASLPLGRRQRVEILKAILRNAELLILADGADVRDLVPDDDRIRLIHLEGHPGIGDKRNFGCERSAVGSPCSYSC